MTTLQHFGLRTSTAITAFTTGIAGVLAQGQFLGDVPDIGGTPSDLRGAILSVLGTVLSFMALVAVVVIVIAGIRLVVAGSEDTQRDKAKKMIIYAIIGLIIIILASAIVSFVAETMLEPSY